MDNNISEILEKVIGLLGYDAYDAFVKVHLDSRRKRIEYRTDNEISIKKEILENTKLTLEQKMKLNAVLGKSLQSLNRELQILNIAIDNMDEDANVNNLREDWILEYLDKASRITEEDMQLVWGKLFSFAASNKNICSKTLLNSLFLMGTDEINDFLNICQYCLVETEMEGCMDRIFAYPIIFYSNHVEAYNHQRISSLRLQKLQNLGLIDIDFKSEYIFSKKQVKLRYKNKIIEVENNKKIKIGNVRFTYEGFLLYQMSERIYNSYILNHIIEIWMRRGYDICLDGRKMKGSAFSNEDVY